ncbi:MAG: hypothetical protein IAF38_22545, partial [Bacteroidia bacterium]|nr:hypothetical protein [Bacteroidia bacterium]
MGNRSPLEYFTEKASITLLQKDVLCAIAYFDVFSYPLKISEIAESIKSPSDPAELINCLVSLINRGLLETKDNFYYLKGSVAENIEKRKIGNAGAEKVFPRALRSAKLISRFPFVEGVCISGSLSKNYFDKDADVDFFIITKSGRLWICRTFLIAFKKIFLFNSKKYFCVNYFVDI